MTFTPEERIELEKMVKESVKRELPELLGRSLVQIKEYFLKNIL